MFHLRAEGKAPVNRRHDVRRLTAHLLQDRCGFRGGLCCGGALLIPRESAAVAVWRLGRPSYNFVIATAKTSRHRPPYAKPERATAQRVSEGVQ